MKKFFLIFFFSALAFAQIADRFKPTFNTVEDLVNYGNPRSKYSVVEVLDASAIGRTGSATFYVTNTDTGTNLSDRIYSGHTNYAWALAETSSSISQSAVNAKLDATNGVAINLSANAITLASTNLLSTLTNIQAQVNTRGDAIKTVILGRNSSIAPVAPYDSIPSGAGNFGPTGGETSFEFINVGNIHRIRQSGEAIRAKIYLASKTGLSTLKIKVWRYNGSTYDLVNQSADILGSITAGSTNAITISIPSIKVGDYIGCRVTYSSASVQNFVDHLSTATTIYSVADATPGSSAYAWTAQTATAGFAVPIELDMTSPAMVAIGDSIMAGHPNNYSFVETSAINLIESSIPAKVAEGLGLTYQNVAIGGQTMTNIAARFVNDVVALNPKWVLLQGGVNDIDLGGSEASFTNSLNFCITNAQAIGARVIYVAILPWSNGTTANHVTRAQFNSDAQAILAARGEYFVDAGSYVGQYRDGNAAGNMDDIQSAYNADGVHFTPLGYTQIAAGILEQFNGQTFDAVSAGTVRAGSSVMQNGSVKAEKFRAGSTTIVQGGIDASRFGIGTTNSGSALTVKGGTVGDQNLFTVQNALGTPVAYIYQDSGSKGVIDILDNAGAMKARLRANSSTNAIDVTGGINASDVIAGLAFLTGNTIYNSKGVKSSTFGIGTTNSSSALTIKGGSSGNQDLATFQNSDGNSIGYIYADISNRGVFDLYDGSGNLKVRIRANGATNAIDVVGGINASDVITAPSIQTGSGTNGMVVIADTNGTHFVSFKANTAMTGDLNIVLPASGFTDLLKAEWDGGTNVYLVPAVDGTDYLSPSTAQTVLTNYFEFALGDETTAITTGTKVTWRAPFAFTIKSVRASLTTASSSGNPAFNIKEAGTTIFSTTLTIDASETTSTTAATAAVVSDSSIANDAEITFIVDTAGTGAAGAKIKIYYVRQ